MKKIMPYKDINQVLKYLRVQVLDSVPYVMEEGYQFNNPEELFKWLKLQIRFKDDPKDRELLQAVPTLLEDNYWGQSGLGDCDCFTILGSTYMYCQGWNNVDIALAGNKRSVPSHIYNLVEWNGRWHTFDLTNPFFDYERSYKYIQEIPFF